MANIVTTVYSTLARYRQQEVYSLSLWREVAVGSGIAIAIFFVLLVFTPSTTFARLDETSGEQLIKSPSQSMQPLVNADSDDLNDLPRWSKVEIEFTGPNSVGMSTTANPFKILVDVQFTGPSNEVCVVPAFYDGDGAGSLDGDVWKVRFSPDEVGQWSFITVSSEPLLYGHYGTFDVTSPTGCSTYGPGDLPDFQCVGRLEYVGEHYLKFTDGPYWLKGGEDDPEDFLGPGVTAGFASKEGAVDYLANKGINSMYIMLHNVNGDQQNVWPWVGSTQAEAKTNHEHFDVAKLGEWDMLFSYIQDKGIVLHLVWEDDSAWTGFNRAMYYREMIARFGHHNGLYWNIAEEFNENYTPNQVKDFAQMIQDLDPYDHPITVHHAGGLSNWEPFVGDDRFSLTSFQTGDSPQNAAAASWFDLVESSGRTIPISFDETGKLDASERDLARHIVWSVYAGGGNFELHSSPLTDYRDFSAHFDDLALARTFMEGIPYWQMRPVNEIVVDKDGYAFGKSGVEYVIYIPAGGSVRVDLSSAVGEFIIEWFNPRMGTSLSGGMAMGGVIQTFNAPFSGDAVLHLDQIGDLQTLYLPAITKSLP